MATSVSARTVRLVSNALANQSKGPPPPGAATASVAVDWTAVATDAGSISAKVRRCVWMSLQRKKLLVDADEQLTRCGRFFDRHARDRHHFEGMGNVLEVYYVWKERAWNGGPSARPGCCTASCGHNSPVITATRHHAFTRTESTWQANRQPFRNCLHHACRYVNKSFVSKPGVSDRRIAGQQHSVEQWCTLCLHMNKQSVIMSGCLASSV